MKWYTLTAQGIILVVYTVIGGVIFSELERRHEDDLREEFMSSLREFVDSSPCLNFTSVGNAYALLEDLKDSGLVVKDDGVTRQSLWDFRSSLFVSTQLIATIGFPSAAPRSSGGRGFTVPFALLGIPLFLLTAIAMGQILNRLAETFRLCTTRLCRRPTECSPRVFRTLVILLLGIIFFIIIPSLIFKSIEPWTYGDAFYFSFITLFTIGFGDFVPSYNDVPWMSDNYRNWYRLAIACWIMLLSAWFAGVLVAIQTTITTPALMKLSKTLDDEVLDNEITTNVNLGLHKSMRVKAEPRVSSYNQYQQQGWQQHGIVGPYDLYSQQQQQSQTSAYSNHGNDNNYGEITRLAV